MLWEQERGGERCGTLREAATAYQPIAPRASVERPAERTARDRVPVGIWFLTRRRATAGPRLFSSSSGTRAMTTFLIFGGVWFWIFVTIFTVALFVTVVRESGFAATGVVIVALLAFSFLSPYPTWSWVRDHPGESFLWVAKYFGAGLVYALCKWARVVFLAKASYRTARDEFLARNRVTSVGELSDAARKDLRDHVSHLIGARVVSPGRNVRTILFWIAWWPLSLVWLFLSDPFARIARGLYTLTSSIFGRLSRWAFRDVRDELDAIGLDQRK